jgi:triphosphoribosyl-dephospho-CoA synthase
LVTLAVTLATTTSARAHPRAAVTRYEILAALAVDALVEEAELTPKPALVDARGHGAHRDLDLDLMRRSAHALRPTFEALASVSEGRRPGRALRERLAAIGRAGEKDMFAATAGANAHRGAIWSLGLLVSAAAMAEQNSSPARLATVAGAIARHPDRFAPVERRNGALVCARYGVPGARGEAERGFPHVVWAALPALRAARRRGVSERLARLDALVAIIASLDDTCLLHRGGRDALDVAKRGAGAILEAGGTSTPAGRLALRCLEEALLARNASPGGSADLLAAALFLDRLQAWRGPARLPQNTGGELVWKR